MKATKSSKRRAAGLVVAVLAAAFAVFATGCSPKDPVAPIAPPPVVTSGPLPSFTTLPPG